MHTPLHSVTALARFELVGDHLLYAKEVLSHETDWQEWINQIELHGLSGFVNKHMDEHKLPIPDALVLPLKALKACLLYTSPSPRDKRQSRMPSSA